MDQKLYYVEKGKGKTLKFRCMHAMEPWATNSYLADKFTLEQFKEGFQHWRIAWPAEYIDQFKSSVFTQVKRFALDERQAVKNNPF